MANSEHTQDGALPRSRVPGVLRDRFTINMASPIPQLSLPTADAFTVVDKRESARPLFALVCRPGFPVRANIMRTLKGAQAPGLLQLVDWGPVVSSSTGTTSLCVIYERPQGGRLMETLQSEITPVDEYTIIRRVIEPMLALLKDLEGRGITHRAIRPTNIFLMDEGGERLALGDCTTCPPAFDQPVAFEALESCLCSPIARGNGSHNDDCYSFGVTLLCLLLGRNPVGHLEDETIIRHKVQYGSYSALVGENRVPLSMIELLRGLLSDDIHLRWGVEAIELWLSGRRLSPIQHKHERRAARGFPFNDREYMNCRDLAMAMSRHWDQALGPVVDGKLELWLKRAVEDLERAATVAEIARAGLSGTSNKQEAFDLTLFRVLLELDPLVPIRYKGFTGMPDGLGNALALAMVQKTDLRLLTEMINRDVPRAWVEVRKGHDLENGGDIQSRELRSFLSQSGIGFGIERCLYEMNDSLQCLSPILADEYVVDLKDLLPALDAVANEQADGSKWPVDRHIAAFMGARSRADIERQLVQLASSDQSKGLIALLNLFAVFQHRNGPEQVPALAAWIGGLAAPLIKSYHSRERRAILEKELPKAVRRGSLVEIYNLFENPGEREKDTKGFSWAQAQYRMAAHDLKFLDAEEKERNQDATRIGRQSVAVLGIVVGAVATAFAILTRGL